MTYLLNYSDIENSSDSEHKAAFVKLQGKLWDLKAISTHSESVTALYWDHTAGGRGGGEEKNQWDRTDDLSKC